ncbi:MAG: DUF790 family protein [Lentisphaeria bacterium]|nr:DUF790 family protein [Lentisphaeria bacterium]
MLTKDLLRYKVSGAYAKPSFIAVTDPRLLSLAERLIAIFENSTGSTREELDEQLDHLTAAYPDVKLARGLVKILQDRAEFSGCGDQDYPAARHALFLRSAALLNSPECPADPAEFRTRLMEHETVLQSAVYPDLPENEQLLSVKKTFPKELLERYNMSLAQSLMLFSDGLDCQVSAEDQGALRRLLKYLKFFRLLFRAELVPGKKKADPPMIRLKIDGPASILDNSTKYGLQLASFFPAVCSMKLWQVSCSLKLRTRTLRLKLDESSRLVCHYTNFGAYIPEEFKMFQDYFNLTPDRGWTLVPREAYLKLSGNQLTFPDFRFRSDSGMEIDVELFHQWHKTPLKERMDYLEKHPETPLILGVDRCCLKQEDELKERLLARPGNFLFGGFPGVDNVIKALNHKTNTDGNSAFALS